MNIGINTCWYSVISAFYTHNRYEDTSFTVVLFQAVRELLTNVARHAQAQHVKVIIASSDGDVRITVQDDGIGFDKAVISDTRKTSGFGLYNLSERLSYMGGHLEVGSGSWGTRVTLTASLGEG